MYHFIANVMLKSNMALYFIFGLPVDTYSGVDRGINKNQFKKSLKMYLYIYLYRGHPRNRGQGVTRI